MNKLFTPILIIFVVTFCGVFPVEAKVQPSPVNQDSSVPWSKITDDPFEGKIVYDKDFDGFGGSHAVVSSWSSQAIRITYFWQEKKVDYYKQVKRTRTVQRNNRNEEEVYWETEPVYKTDWLNKNPETIIFSLNGKIYNYEGGKISDELATALANAPNGNMKIRLVWSDGSTTDTTIGSGTVKAFKTIYQ